MLDDVGWERLTRVEREALRLLLAGHSPAGVAYDLGVAEPMALELVSGALRKIVEERDAA